MLEGEEAIFLFLLHFEQLILSREKNFFYICNSLLKSVLIRLSAAEQNKEFIIEKTMSSIFFLADLS